jgi:lysophospholipase L1-like esterase
MWWLFACTAEDTAGPGDSDAPAVLAPDPDVNSFVPASFPPVAPARLVYFGDSITAGYGVANGDNTYPALLEENNDRQWPADAGDDLTTRFGALDVLDVSFPGATTDDVLSYQLPAVDRSWGPVVEGPVLVAGTIGGNDLMAVLFAFGDVDAGVAQILENLRVIGDFFLDETRFPDGAYLAITNVYEPTDAEGQVPECFYGLDLSAFITDFDGLNASSRTLAEEQGWAWVDLRGHFLGHGFRHADEQAAAYDEADPTLWLQDDCIHPNVRGHHELRRLFRSAFDAEPLPLVVPAPE